MCSPWREMGFPDGPCTAEPVQSPAGPRLDTARDGPMFHMLVKMWVVGGSERLQCLQYFNLPKHWDPLSPVESASGSRGRG